MAHDIRQQFLQAHLDYADALFRHCYFRVYDRERAKDLVQEAFSKTWVVLAEGKEIENLRAFLYRVLHNLIVDEIRRKKPLSLDQLLEEGFFQEGESAEDVESRASARDMLRKLGEVEEPYRHAVMMRFLDDMSPKEIAAVLGVTENVVSVRIHRGMEKLRKLME